MVRRECRGKKEVKGERMGGERMGGEKGEERECCRGKRGGDR